MPYYISLIKRAIHFILLSIFLVLSHSCGYYYPVSHNVMRVKEKNDISLSYAFDTNKFHAASLAYGLTSNIALTGFYMRFNPDLSAPGYYAGGGITGYTKWKRNMYPAIELGLGYGRYDKGNTDFAFQYYKQYIQPSLAFSNDYFDIALSCKFTRLNFHYAHLKEYNPEDLAAIRFSYGIETLEKSPYYFFEFAPTLGIGYKFIKIKVQDVRVFKLGKTDLPIYDNNLWIMVDVRYNLKDMPKFKRTNNN